jgi:spore coat protein U-like protein
MSKDVTVTADIVAGCRINTLSGGAWGDIDLGSQNGTSTATVQSSLVGAAGAGLRIECTPGMLVNVTANAGSHAVGNQRYMAGPASSTPIAYDLYANGSATAWTTQAVPLIFTTSGAQTLPVVAKATLPGNARAGNYSDTVQIVLSW